MSWPGEGEHDLEDQDGGGLGLPCGRSDRGGPSALLDLAAAWPASTTTIGGGDPRCVTRRWCRGSRDRYDGGDGRGAG